MASTREMRLRIRSVKNLSQVTRALETVSASKVRRAVQAYSQTKPYSEKALKVLLHVARQPGHQSLHPLLVERDEIKKTLVVMVSSDRGLAGAYNVNILRHTLHEFDHNPVPVQYIAVGKKGRDMLIRRRKNLLAEFSNLPNSPSFTDVASIGQLIVDEYLNGDVDEVYIAYTEFGSMLRQTPITRKLLPYVTEIVPDGVHKLTATHKTNAVFTYEPGQKELLDEIIPRFTALQVYQAIISSMASEHAARMVAMRNATDSAKELISVLQLDYNKARQQSITNDILDITGGADALMKAVSGQS